MRLFIFNDIWSLLTIQQHAVQKQTKKYFVCQSARGFGLNGADGGTIESGCESTYGYFLVDWTRADPIKPTPLKYHLNN